MKESTSYTLHSIGLLILRIGIGVMFIIHGCPKLFAGPDQWRSVGAATASIGITFAPVFWGFAAAMAETLGGLFFVFGFLTRIASLFLFLTMGVAFFMHFSNGDSFTVYSHALESAILFFSMIIIGPGKYSVDSHLFK